MSDSTTGSWNIIDKHKYSDDDSNWIEEEDRLLNWAESSNFEKTPLNHTSIHFIYLNLERDIVGILKTEIELENNETSAVLYRSDFFDKIATAKTPQNIFTEPVDPLQKSWLEKTYHYEDSAIYSIPICNDNDEYQDKKTPYCPLNFSKDVMKITASLSVFHDIYDIVVIMREANPISALKSIIKPVTSKPGKTKKVRISDDIPNEYVFSKHNPVSGKRRTKRVYK